MSSVSAVVARPACAAAACWFAYQPIVEPLVEFAEEDKEQWRDFPTRLLGRLQPTGPEWTLVGSLYTLLKLIIDAVRAVSEML